MNDSEGVFLCTRLLVANESIHPRIRHLDGQFVRSRLQGGRRIYPIRDMPNNSQRLAIHGDVGQIPDIAQIDPKMRARFEPIGRRLDRLGIGSYTLKILHPGVCVVAPRF